jgi:hypothetical protein
VLAGLATQSIAAERVMARGNVPVISGGVGEDSVERLKAREKDFNLKLVLTLIEGNYLADVGVTIRDAAGKAVVEHVTEGPILMARLPAGTYLVTARYNAVEQSKKVALRSDRLHTEYLRWPADPRVDFPGPVDGRRDEAAPRPGTARAETAPRRDAAPGAVAFVSGGIGETAQAQLLVREKEFNLKLVFTLIEGNYIADVAVEVKDASGRTVISHVAEGPFFLAQLPSGVYFLTAAYEGRTQTRKVSVAAGRLRTEYLRWKSNPETDTVLPPER